MSTIETTDLLNDSPLLKSDDGGHKYVKREGGPGAYKYTYTYTYADGAKAPARRGKSMGFAGAVKRYGGTGISPISQKAEDASVHAQDVGTVEAHKAARDAHDAAATFHGNRKGRPDDYDSEVEDHHIAASDMHSKEVNKSGARERIRVEAMLFKSQDRTAGPPPRGGVYDALAAGMVDPAVDRPRYAGRAPNQVIGVDMNVAGERASTLAYQKPRQIGSSLELAKSAIVEAVKAGYRAQLMVAEDNPTARLVAHANQPGACPTVPLELRKAMAGGEPDAEAVVDHAMASLRAASSRDENLRRILALTGVTRGTLCKTYNALGLTPVGVLAGY